MRPITPYLCITFFATLQIPPAHSSKAAPALLQNFEKKVKYVTEAPPPCPENRPDTNQSYKMCIESVCGKESNVESSTMYRKKYLKGHKAILKDHHRSYKNTIGGYVKDRLKHDLALLKGTLNMIDSDDFSMDNNFAPIYDITIAKEFNGQIKCKPNGTTLAENDKTLLLTSQERKLVLESAGKIKLCDIYKFLEPTFSPEKFLQKKYPDATPKQSILRMISTTKEKFDLLKNKNSFFRHTYLADSSHFNEMSFDINQYGIVSENLTMHIGTLTLLENFYDAFNKIKPYPFANSKFDIKSIVKNFNIRKKILSKIKRLEDTKELTQYTKRLTRHCAINKFAGVLLPAQTEIEQLKNNFSGYKDDVKQAIEKTYSKQTHSSISNMIDSIRLRPPPEKLKWTKRFHQSITKSTKNAKEEHRFYLQSNQKKVQYLLKLQEHIGNDESDGESIYASTFDDLVELCLDGEHPVNEPNQTNTKNRIIAPNWKFAKFPEYVRSAIYHEIGHNIYDHLKKQEGSSESFDQFDKTVSCLNGMHPQPKLLQNESILNSQKKPFTECRHSSEDYPDLITMLIPNSFNVACDWVFLKKGDEYLRKSIVSSDDDTPHSSHLFRLLHLDVVRRGSLTPECEAYLEHTEQTPLFTNCTRE